MLNTLILDTICPNLGKIEFSTKIRLCHFLAPNYRQKKKKKKTDKTSKPVLRKTYKQINDEKEKKLTQMKL